MRPQYSVSELKEVFALAKDYNISQIIVPGLEVHFRDSRGEAPVIVDPADTLRMPTEDEMLMWSSPVPDEKAQR